jgi:hypothetical protein
VEKDDGAVLEGLDEAWLGDPRDEIGIQQVG